LCSWCLALAFVVGCGSSSSSGVRTSNGGASSGGTLTTEKFRAAVVDKTANEVIQAVGKPHSTQEPAIILLLIVACHS
jgi:hypothetical protein